LGVGSNFRFKEETKKKIINFFKVIFDDSIGLSM
jgi:hypothetical protein